MRKIINKQKAPKDTLLNSILQEIDDEKDSIIDFEVLSPVKKEKKKNKKSEQLPLLRVLFYFFATLIVVFLMFMIVMVTLTEEKIQEKKSHEVSTAPTLNTPKEIVPQKIHHFENFSKTIFKEEGNKIVGVIRKKEENKEPLVKEEKRQTAKEALLEQMQD